MHFCVPLPIKSTKTFWWQQNLSTFARTSRKGCGHSEQSAASGTTLCFAAHPTALFEHMDSFVNYREDMHFLLEQQ